MTKNKPQPVYSDFFAAANSIDLFKQLLQQKSAELEAKFDPQHSVSPLLETKSDFIDQILISAWIHFLGPQCGRHSLIAVGGYGRKELFPHSDIDILVLIDAGYDADFTEQLSDFFSFLWDIGLKPGQSVRTISECIAAARQDQVIMTSLLELRLIGGDENLFQALEKRIAANEIWPAEEFFLAKMDEQKHRYTKFHDTAYNLEPNIKEGPGGLRDIQIIAWVFRRQYHSETLQDLVKYEFLPESEYKELIAAQRILWSIRYALHLLTGRGEDRLLFDYQRELAARFGFVDDGHNRDVEQFMQHYYKTVVRIERLNEMLLQLFRERFVSKPEECKTIAINANFNSICGYLEAANEQIFERQPLALLEIFLILQHRPSLKGIRATTIRLIRKNLPLIDAEFRSNRQACRLFIEIFRQSHGLTHQLRRMNRYGVLSAYLPCFANIVARMQYDLFHIYTVDEHTLFVIRNLRRFSLEKHNQELPFCNDVFLHINKPEILYLAGLFHDIAKGRGGDHSVLGEEVAREFCQRHDLSQHDTKLICWLVRHHLIMSMTAQRKDISDPDIIHEFASLVKNHERLNYLYLLTVADIRATSPKLWNSWKDSLLKELYVATHKAIRRGLQTPMAISERISETKTETRNELLKLGVRATTIDKTWKFSSDEYFLKYTAEEIVWQTIAIAANGADELPLVLLRPQTQRGSAEVFVYTKNADYLFSICTATLDQLGLTILDARIITTRNEFVLNSFQVLEQSGDPIKDFFRELRICTTLRKNLLVGRVKRQRNINRVSRQAKHFPIATEIHFHEDPMHGQTILELITTDRAGLLSKIGKAFRKHQIILHNAKITTIGSRVEDMFYISDTRSNAITDIQRQDKLRHSILNILDEPNGS